MSMDTFGRGFRFNLHEEKPEGQKMTVTRVKLNSGGYDLHGRYYGGGGPLWSVCNEDGACEQFRARDLTAAKLKAREMFPDAAWGKATGGFKKALTSHAQDLRIKKLHAAMAQLTKMRQMAAYYTSVEGRVIERGGPFGDVVTETPRWVGEELKRAEEAYAKAEAAVVANAY